MDAQALVFGTHVGVIGTPGATRIGKDQNAFLVIHEGRSLSEISVGSAAFDSEPVADAQRAFEIGGVELAALDQNFAEAFSCWRVHMQSAQNLIGQS